MRFSGRRSGLIAKDRLRLLLTSERLDCTPQMMTMLKNDMIRAVDKYFAVQDAEGHLMNRFFLVSQLEAKDGGEAIRSGNARVVRARLADAKFFYDQDRLVTLESRVPGLAHVVYHNKLGTQAERVERVKAIAARVADLIGANREQAVRAAQLAKVDLLTQMVGEFPELQGIMGEYYALHDGEDPIVAQAILEHYQPRYAGDNLPSTPVSIAVALADKLETLSGLFGIGQMPTGDKDPFALRRHALGVLRMILEKGLTVSLTDLVTIGYEALKAVSGITDARAELLAFFEDRLRVIFKEKGYSAQEIDELNILQATFVAMKRAFAALGVKPQIALIDGNQKPKDFPCPTQTVVKGDARSLSIAAASIVAKVYRDRLMADLAQKYPYYGFEKNAGYGTKAHIEGLKLHGIIPEHRKSYRPIQEIMLEKSA